jgi:hypothetical protein
MARSGADELFDLSTDPNEQDDVAALHPGLAARYRALCQRWMARRQEDYVTWLKPR